MCGLLTKLHYMYNILGGGSLATIISMCKAKMAILKFKIYLALNGKIDLLHYMKITRTDYIVLVCKFNLKTITGCE